MTNTKSNPTPKLTTLLLRNMEDRLKRINPEDLNEEGHAALRDVRTALEDLVDVITAYQVINNTEALEAQFEQANEWHLAHSQNTRMRWVCQNTLM